MANNHTWEHRFRVLKTDGRFRRVYWLVPVRKKLEPRANVLDPSQLSLFD